MKIFYQIFNDSGECLLDNFPIKLTEEMKSLSSKRKILELHIDEKIVKCRIGTKTFNEGIVYILTYEPSLVNKYKFFEEIVDRSNFIFQTINITHQQFIKEQEAKLDDFMHNVISLNSYSIQSLFALIPQKDLPENINAQKDFIRKIIIDKPNITVDTLLRLIKNSIATKIEFTVFERLNISGIKVNAQNHSIRNIILTILQIFIDDFDKNKIEVSLESSLKSERRLNIDDEALFVSLFYLFQNSIKYCCRNTKYYINFHEDTETFSVSFRMTSVKIDLDEVEKLMEYGYRSKNISPLNIEGKGIGMNRIVKTLNINNAELRINPRYNDFEKIKDSVTYQSNEFLIVFNNQRKWILDKPSAVH